MIAIKCKCGNSYQLNDSHAGKLLRCRQCGEVIAVPKLMMSTSHSTSRDKAEGHSTPKPATSSPGHHAAEPPVARPPLAKPPGSPDATTRVDDQRFLLYENLGRYHFVRPIDSGGMGKVNLARDLALKRNVALKELLEGIADVPNVQRRFIAEAEITGQLEHPGIVPVYALGVNAQGKPFYAMRFVEGQTLKQAIDDYHKSPRPAELRALLRRFVMVCQTMAFAHDRGVIHRDLKPSNIMLGRFGETLVMDWGIAKPLRGQSDDSTLGDVAVGQLAGRPDLTTPDLPIGTPAYMPPEQALGKVDELDVRSDVYSLGAVLYELLTGTPPYYRGSKDELLIQAATSSPQKPSAVCRYVPRALEAVCLNAMAHDRDDRYPNATDLGEQVQRWLDDEPVDAYREPVRERVYRWSRKHKAGVVSGAMALATVLLIGSIATVLYQHEHSKATALARLADDYKRQSEEAKLLAQEKETKATELAQEAEIYRRQANEAMLAEAKAKVEVDQAQQKMAGIEAELKAKAEQSEELNKKLVDASAELKIAQAKLEAETKLAGDHATQAADLERQVVKLRDEADELRALSVKLIRQAAELLDKTQPPAIVANTPWEDFAQRDPATFDVVASNGTEGVAASDTSRVRGGHHQSLRVTSDSSGLCVTYPKSRNANWDLSDCDYLTFAVGTDDPAARYTGLSIRIGRGSQVIEYAAANQDLSQIPKIWAPIKIPFPAGDDRWVKRESNPLNLKHVDWIELHFQTSTPKLTVWLDDLSFGADPRRLARALVPDPDRAAAEYVVATKGEADVWVLGPIIKVRTMSDIPKDPFKIRAVYGGQEVTDDGFALLGALEDCHSISVSSTRITDEALEHLKNMKQLVGLGIYNSRVTDIGVGHLRNLPNLSWLHLNGAALTGSGFEHFAGHEKLTSLDLMGTQLNDEGVRYISALPKLSSISLRDTKVTDRALETLGSCQNLTGLTLMCDGGTPKALRNLARLPLHDLTLGNSESPHGLSELEGIPLWNLTVGTGGYVEDSFLESLRLFPGLSYLSFWNINLNERQARCIRELKGLKSLSLIGGGDISDSVLKHASEIAGLNGIYVQPPITIGDENLQALAKLERFTSLTIPAASVEPASVLKLQQALPNCKIAVKPEIQKAIDELRAKQ